VRQELLPTGLTTHFSYAGTARLTQAEHNGGIEIRARSIRSLPHAVRRVSVHGSPRSKAVVYGSSETSSQVGLSIEENNEDKHYSDDGYDEP
jgi:hypothetical protein